MMHTKGPWKAERYPQEQQSIADHRIIAGKKVIAFCPTGYPFANARLIAASPELLDVVRDCVNFLADLNTTPLSLETFHRAKELHKRAYTAHSKTKSHADTLKGG